MNSRNSIRLFTALAALMVSSTMAFAHNGIEHVMGTVVEVTDSSITVETVKHAKVAIQVVSSTMFTRKDGTASIKDLKPGERVVINAKEAANHKLAAVSVKWGASSKMKMPPNHKM
jgi:type 1 fimbria pilin